ncbi:hypothetical protein [Pseudomonas sp. Q1-7]|uniref:hypothetical protein n=1 Tax=Pseudomonas sp. Q1-7 TaxID=3020843 RepID=UPI002300A4A1|nr:hypothetical protein [Pseudomonas sp. Q1-7]
MPRRSPAPFLIPSQAPRPTALGLFYLSFLLAASLSRWPIGGWHHTTVAVVDWSLLVRREYVPRVNQGGNFCGHEVDAPKLDLITPTTQKHRPGILSELQARVKSYYTRPTMIPSLRAANRSATGRQQRSERREACLQLLAAILEFTDVASLRCGVPTSSGFLSLTLDYLVRYTGLHPRRAERAMADLKRANLMTVKQARQLQADGTWRGLAAVKAVNKLLFTAFGLGMRLRHERDRATKRLAKKAAKLGGTLTGWARNALLMGRSSTPQFRPPAPRSPDRSPRGVDAFTYQRARTELLVALMQTHPGLSAAEYHAKADQILHDRMHA